MTRPGGFGGGEVGLSGGLRMSTILDTIAAHARKRVAADKAQLPLEELKERCREMGKPGENSFLTALKRPGIVVAVAGVFINVLRCKEPQFFIMPQRPDADMGQLCHLADL